MSSLFVAFEVKGRRKWGLDERVVGSEAKLMALSCKNKIKCLINDGGENEKRFSIRFKSILPFLSLLVLSRLPERYTEGGEKN